MTASHQTTSESVPLTTTDRWVVVGVTVLFLLFGTIAALSTHTFSFFADSKKHHYYIETVLDGRWPRVTRDPVTMESHQPPLYHVTAAPFVALGERWSLDVGVLFARLWSLLIGAGAIVLTAMMVRQLFPTRRYLAGTAAAIVGLNPQLYVVSAQVNNDAIAGTMGAAVLYLIVRQTLGWTPDRRRDLLIGVVSGLAMLSKMAVWPLVAILLLVAAWPRRRDVRSLVRMLLPVVILAGPWLIRNMVVYGEPTVLRLMTEYFSDEQRRAFLTSDGLREWFSIFFQSYWTKYRHLAPWGALDNGIYQALKVVSLVAVVAAGTYIVKEWRRLERRRRLALVLCGVCVLIVFGGVFSYSLRFWQPWGRYLFPVQSVVGMVLALGLLALAPSRARVVMGGAIVIGLLALNVASLRLLMFAG